MRGSPFIPLKIGSSSQKGLNCEKILWKQTSDCSLHFTGAFALQHNGFLSDHTGVL